jgi:hypothetical protein
VCLITGCVCNQRIYYSQHTTGFALYLKPWYVLYLEPTGGNLPTEMQSEMAPGESDSGEIPMPTDSELEELTLFDMIHFNELENPLVLDDDFFPDS